MGLRKKGLLKWTHKNKEVVLYNVLEAKESLVFTVTEEDIKKATKLKGYSDPNCCVAACAVRRQFTDAVFQRDTAYTLQVHSGKVFAVRYRFGSDLRKAIASFDNGEPFLPGNYKLLAPSKSQTLEAKRASVKKKPLTTRKIKSKKKFMIRGVITPLS